MFIFSRPFSAVAAALATALLVVCIDSACHPTDMSVSAVVTATVANGEFPACATPTACGIVRAGS
jgi:hypothetical protein